MGMYHKQDLENLEKYAPNNTACKRAVVVGGGLIGIELAEMLNSRNIPVTFLVREKKAQLIQNKVGSWGVEKINENLLIQGSYDGLYILQRINKYKVDVAVGKYHRAKPL